MKKSKKKALTRRAIQLLGLAMVEKKHGHLLAEDVFEDAKNAKHPLHGEFEWDEHAGWRQWNLEIARSLISMHRLDMVDLKTGKSVSVPMFINLHNLPDQFGPQEYHRLSVVMKSKDHMAMAMETGIREMSAIVKRWTWHDSLGVSCRKFIVELQSLKESFAMKKHDH